MEITGEGDGEGDDHAEVVPKLPKVRGGLRKGNGLGGGGGSKKRLILAERRKASVWEEIECFEDWV